MIEMSVDKETVLLGEREMEPVVHLQTQRLTECNERCNDASVAVVPVGSDDTSKAVFVSMVPMMEPSSINPMADSQHPAESLGLGARTNGRAVRTKNGQHQLQHQKLNKRRYSMNVSFKHPGFSKRRRRVNSESDPVLPTNFLLGGNIFDPLNLNSLLDEEVNRTLNAETPKSSPLPAKSHDPVEILIPKDITDPLNLNSAGEDGRVLVSPVKSGGRRRHRNRHHVGAGPQQAPQTHSCESDKGAASEASATALAPSTVAPDATLQAPREGAVLLCSTPLSESPRPYELNTSINCRDEVVLPILPCARSRRTPSGTKSQSKALGGSSCLSSVVSCQGPSSRSRKRRRASGRVTPCSIPPTPPAKQGSMERRQGPAACSQTFHTPLVGEGSGLHPAVSRHRQQWHHSRYREHKFQYGNYNRYYGCRKPGLNEDPRMQVLRPEWFHGKVVLDLGCNTGHLTLSIAKNLRPARILGLDIDDGLVRAARHNLRYFLSETLAQEVRHRKEPSIQENSLLTSLLDCEQATGAKEPKEAELCAVQRGPLAGDWFPLSLRVYRGPIAAPPLFDTHRAEFPANIAFIKENYIVQSEALLQCQQPEYDVILCLRLTKWVHLNWGDGGVRRLFRRAFRQLHPGGLFILEPQPWSSYGKRKKLTGTIYKNYNNIRLKPDQFSSYLTSEVGFSSYELIGTPKGISKGFQRTIYLFHKGPSSLRK